MSGRARLAWPSWRGARGAWASSYAAAFDRPRNGARSDRRIAAWTLCGPDPTSCPDRSLHPGRPVCGLAEPPERAVDCEGRSLPCLFLFLDVDFGYLEHVGDLVHHAPNGRSVFVVDGLAHARDA